MRGFASRVAVVLAMASVVHAQAPPGTVFTVGTGVHSASSVAPRTIVEYAPAVDLYLVAWESSRPVLGSERPNVLGQMVTPDGQLAGSSITVSPVGSSSAPSSAPQITATNDSREPFLVVAEAGVNRIYARTLSPSGSGEWATLIGASEQHTPDVGCGTSPADTHAVIVYEDRTLGVIQALRWEVARRFVDGVARLTTAATVDRSPAIARTGGASGVFLVVFEREGSGIHGTIVDRDLNVLAPVFQVAAGGLASTDPDVDGDGTHWLVAFERASAEGPAGHDLVCVGVSYDPASGATAVSPPRVIAGEIGVDEMDPAVRLAGQSYFVSWLRDFGGGDYDVWTESIELLACGPCETATQRSTSSLAEREPGVAVGPGDEALLAWASSASPPSASTIRAMRVPLRDGIAVDLGGGCSGGGSADASCAHVPGSFGLRTRGAAPLAPAALLFGVAATSAPCGPCTLVTNPIVTVPMLTDATGEAQLALQLDDPGLVGGALVAQWLVVGNGGCVSVLSLSNGLAVQIQ